MLQSIAIIGSGPSGLFCADALIRQNPALQIDVYDRLPTPYGLVRFGVAPDHQGTKAVTRQFDRLFANPGFRFRGGAEIGGKLTLAALRAQYDAVVLAIGAHRDRKLGIPGEDLPGVQGSMAFVGWYNGHPDCAKPPLLDSPSIAVIGNGNVALDIVRLLGKTPEELKASDLSDAAIAAIAAAPVADIHLIGRRGPWEASFTSAELAELGKLERVRPIVQASDLEGGMPPELATALDPASIKVKEKNIEILRQFAERGDEKPVRLHFHFGFVPEAFRGRERLEAIAFQGRPALLAGSAITAIGYTTAPQGDLPEPNGLGRLENEAGRIAPGLYAVGWAKRGPSGTIPTNRADSKAVADLILADFANDAAPAKPGPSAADAALLAAGIAALDFAAWKRIEAAEIAAARPGSPRAKISDWDALRRAASAEQQQQAQQ